MTEHLVRNHLNPRTPDRPTTTYQTIAGASTCWYCRALAPLLSDNDGLVPVDSVEWHVDSRGHGMVDRYDSKHNDLLGNPDVHRAAYCNLRGRDVYLPHECIIYSVDATEPEDHLRAADAGPTPLLHFDTVEVPAEDMAAAVLPIGGAGPTAVVALSDRTGLAVSAGGVDFDVDDALDGAVYSAEIESMPDVPLAVSNPTAENANLLVLVFGTEQSPLEVQVAPAVARPGEPVEIRVPDTVVDADLLGVVAHPDGGQTELGFSEDNGDAVAAFTPPDSGEYPVSVIHEGERRRAALGQVVAGSGGALLPGTFSESLETGEDGVADALHLDVPVDVTEEGTYRLVGELTTSDGTGAAMAEVSEDLAVGQHTLRLTVPGAVLYAVGEDGPFDLGLTLVRRHSRTVTTMEAQVTPTTATAPYQADDFRPASITRPGSRSWSRETSTQWWRGSR